MEQGRAVSSAQELQQGCAYFLDMAPCLCWEGMVAMHLFLGGDVQRLYEDTADQVGHSTDVAVLLLNCHQQLLDLRHNGF